VKIVTDSGMNLAPTMARDLDITIVPHIIQLGDATYRSEIDIDAGAFYGLLESTGDFPTTSLPSPGAFADVYRQLAAEDPEILSINISSGLSATAQAARTAAEMVPEAKVTVLDSLTLSAAQGWLVETAARAAKAGWAKEAILELLSRIRDGYQSVYTIKDLRYLIHGGRISHMKGLLGSMLHLNPVIGVNKSDGSYEQLGIARSEKRAVKALVSHMESCYPTGSELRVQMVHGQNLEGLDLLCRAIEKRFVCHWLPTIHMSTVLGAHTGPSLVGVAFAPQSLFSDFPAPAIATEPPPQLAGRAVPAV